MLKSRQNRRSIRLAELSLEPLEPRLALSATVPAIVTAPPAGSYSTGQDLVFRVSYNTPVTVTGKPAIDLTIGHTVRQATYFEGSGTSTLLFRHTVQFGETDTNGIVLARRFTPSADSSISGNVSLMLGPAQTSHILVDTAAPITTTIAGPAAKVYGEGSELAFSVHFNEPVFVTGSPTLPIEIGGTLRNAAWNGRGSGSNALTFTTRVLAGDLDTDGLKVAGPIGLPSGTTIRDAAGNALNPACAATFSRVLVDAAAPELTTISVVSARPGLVTLQANFSEPLFVKGKPLLPFTLAGQARTAIYAGGSGTSSLKFSYRPVVKETVRTDLVATPQTPLVPKGSSIRDLSANNAIWPATLQSNDLFHLEWASDPQISPDGTQLVYVRNSNDIMTDSTRRSLWLVDLASGRQQAISNSKGNVSQPTWSPDGRQIAFVAYPGGKSEIHLWTATSGKETVLSQLASGPDGLTWSPDGTRLAFTMYVNAPPTALATRLDLPDKPADARWADPADLYERADYQADGQGFTTSAYRQIFVMPLDGKALQVTTGEFDYGGDLVFSPDGNSLVFSANLSADWEYQPYQADLYRLDLVGGHLTQLTTMAGAESQPVFSPDGKQLAFISSPDDPVSIVFGKLDLLDLGSGTVSAIGHDLDLSMESPSWFSNNQILVQYDEAGYRKVGALSLQGTLTPLVAGLSGVGLAQPYLSGGYQFSHGLIAFTSGTAYRPADISVWQQGQVRQLTALNEDVLGHKTLGQVHEISYQSSFDGQTIEGWYITPPDFNPSRKYPLMVEIHGGPHLAYGPHFSAEMQRLATEGYVVFYDNYRGSVGYGNQFALLLDNKYSSPEDYADHDSGVNAMIAKGFIDDRNLFISGGSAGGTATAYAIGLTNRYNAAAVYKPVINFTSQALTSDAYLYQAYARFPGPVWDYLEEYWKRSPISLAGNITSPTLVMTGNNDRRTPISESEQLFQALKLRKVPAAFVRIPGASHAFANRPSRMISKIQYTLAWFGLYHQP